MTGAASPARQRPRYGATVAELARSQKSRRGGPAYSVYVNRPLGRRAAAVAHVLGRTPNQVTAVSALLTYAAIALLAATTPGWAVGVAVTVLLVGGYALDAADGQLARLRGGGSPAGEWLDHMVDAGKIASLHSAVAISAYRSDDLDEAWLLVPLGYTLVGVVLFFAQLLNEQLRRGAGIDPRAAASGASSSNPVLAVLKLPTDYGFFCFVFLLLGSPVVFAVAYTAYFAANAAYLAAASVKWFREMDALGPGTSS